MCFFFQICKNTVQRVIPALKARIIEAAVFWNFSCAGVIVLELALKNTEFFENLFSIEFEKKHLWKILIFGDKRGIFGYFTIKIVYNIF